MLDLCQCMRRVQWADHLVVWLFVTSKCVKNIGMAKAMGFGNNVHNKRAAPGELGLCGSEKEGP